MGSNGQQLSIFLPNGSTKVQVAGTNQNNDHVIWQGVAYAWIIQNPQNVYIAATYNWWWKGAAEVWFDDFTGRTFYFTTPPIPVSQSYDTVFCIGPGVDPGPIESALGGTGHIVVPEVHPLKPPPKLWWPNPGWSASVEP
jgi:hypothetical protein